jgi:hypothetical protein
MTLFEKFSLWINSIFAFLTLLAIIAAIWGEKIRQIWTKPRLKIRLFEPSLTPTTDGTNGWYYLIKVTNERSSSPAKNVRILLTNSYRQGPDNRWMEQRFSGPTQVMWRWPQHTPLYVTVGPAELATFGFLLENANSFQLQLYSYPNNLQRTIPPREPTRLKFLAVSDTAESKPLIIEVAWDGVWVEGRDEMRDHLVVNEIIA